MKKIIVINGILILSALSVVIADAQTNTSQEIGVSAQITKPADAGNKLCPVTGEKINEKSKATYEYNGKIYNFCCPMCIDDFKKDPEKYIKKVEEELAQSKQDKKL